MDLVDLNHINPLMFQIPRSRDPYGSRGSKSQKYYHYEKHTFVEILMDLVDLN